jgi:hypothetical protein
LPWGTPKSYKTSIFSSQWATNGLSAQLRWPCGTIVGLPPEEDFEEDDDDNEDEQEPEPKPKAKAKAKAAGKAKAAKAKAKAKAKASGKAKAKGKSKGEADGAGDVSGSDGGSKRLAEDVEGEKPEKTEKATFAKRYKPGRNPEKWLQSRAVWMNFLFDKLKSHVTMEEFGSEKTFHEKLILLTLSSFLVCMYDLTSLIPISQSTPYRRNGGSIAGKP